MSKKHISYFLTICFFLLSFKSLEEKQITVYLIGDSTLSIKDKRTYPETGWGMPFTQFFDKNIKINNRAMNGRSTSSFIKENRWQPVLETLKEGDYVFIQFGHNDEVSTKKTYTTPEEFKANLLLYVSETRAKKGIPVLITPVARRKFDAEGKVVDTHQEYAQLVREVASKNQVPLIDLSVKSMELLQNYGIEKSKYLFNHLEAGQNPNYPNGKTDDTHFNELGARLMAQLVLAEIKNLNLSLVNQIVKPVEPKK
ncbi:rhamnogalacturonan acetylesterase [Pedobacter cryophilus]|uniref:Rhamnogalacturonan acetylesterase n=1 Tax=Pedobacter cryophilus TaxID=2571271 RepID=A0A4U1CA04_9SPHI|nr:rhamnogalacturonan acetylesterase [Pedobacter cryophilus]TKC00508.1 rhamnogalacturonan acetylesterase [Pedobacter cryophilus]